MIKFLHFYLRQKIKICKPIVIFRERNGGKNEKEKEER
jgi:hypothetical protein